MRIYAGTGGVVLRAQPGVYLGQLNVMVFPPLEGVTETLDIEDETNAALVADLMVSVAPYTLAAGVLSKNAVPVVILPTSRYHQDRQQVEQTLTTLDGYIAFLDGGGTLSQAQATQAIKFLLRFARFVLRWISKRGDPINTTD